MKPGPGPTVVKSPRCQREAMATASGPRGMQRTRADAQWHSNLLADAAAPPVTLSQGRGDSAVIVWPQFDAHRAGQLFLLLFSPLKASFHQETQRVAGERRDKGSRAPHVPQPIRCG